MRRDRILVFDVGTSAIKTALFDAALNPLALSATEYPMRASGAFVETRPTDYLDAMAKGVSKLKETADVSRAAAICITTQGETLLAADEDGAALSPAIVWLDARAFEEAKRLSAAFSEETFYETTGLPEITAALPLAKLMWLKQNQPEEWERARYFLLLEDYLRFQLTGVCVSHASLLTSSGYLNVRTGMYWNEALSYAGVPLEKLPEIVPSGAQCGVLTRFAAAALGLESGVPVYAGAMDQTAALLAASCGKAGAVCETTGTAHVVAAATNEPYFSKTQRLTVYRHALSGQYLYLPIGNTAGMAYRWFRNTFGHENEDYACLDRLAETVTAGCEGVTFLPFLCGAADPLSLPDATACFFGMRLSTTRAQLARAVLESTGYELRLFLGLLKERGCPIDSVSALGGGATSPLWLQMRADIAETTLHVPRVTEATAAGAALLAGWGAGLIEKGEYPRILSEKQAVFEPNPANKAAYDDAFLRYQALCRALTPLFAGKKM